MDATRCLSILNKRKKKNLQNNSLKNYTLGIELYLHIYNIIEYDAYEHFIISRHI